MRRWEDWKRGVSGWKREEGREGEKKGSFEGSR